MHNFNTGVPGKWVIKLGIKKENPYLPCLEFLDEQNTTRIKEISDTVLPCPCTKQHAVYDSQFQMDDNSTGCYQSVSSGGAKQQCCYHE